ncbi:hypothetical protein KGMB01110_24690 [Mediterraneibacter butyricigenes]|uniref:Uncharacterized protein n=1 Tax=Mediterraneibacter butyricigenes TaxID=2316025 RepID=A0A391PEB0_9FIRM|nr:hypothetical protein [Mediterraneibacter butyricigenes]GCA68033.1 hypothetical protein KGMB01110_24690 [Mediterraneibacter butyricigenes]
MVWKITILLWALVLIGSYFVKCSISREERIRASYGGNIKLTPGRIVYLILVFASIIMTFATLVWFLFFKL